MPSAPTTPAARPAGNTAATSTASSNGCSNGTRVPPPNRPRASSPPRPHPLRPPQLPDGIGPRERRDGHPAHPPIQRRPSGHRGLPPDRRHTLRLAEGPDEGMTTSPQITEHPAEWPWLEPLRAKPPRQGSTQPTVTSRRHSCPGSPAANSKFAARFRLHFSAALFLSPSACSDKEVDRKRAAEK